jgi:cytoplasmic iron level regulating protein YaaA (DUF328/UPF0246 family)
VANNDNLKPFKKGYDSRRGTKPKGSKHLTTLIRNILEDDNYVLKLPSGKTLKGAPIQAIVNAVVIKAVDGNLRAFDLLSKHGYGQKVSLAVEGTVERGMSIEEINVILARAEEYDKEKRASRKNKK